MTLVFRASLLPYFASTFALMDESPSAHKITSEQYVEPHTLRSDGVSGAQFRLMTDPQTSGGLLAAVRSDRVHEVVHALHEAGDTAARQVGEVIPLIQSPEGRPSPLETGGIVVTWRVLEFSGESRNWAVVIGDEREPGGPRGLQIRCPGPKGPGGGFDSHPSPLFSPLCLLPCLTHCTEICTRSVRLSVRALSPSDTRKDGG